MFLLSTGGRTPRSPLTAEPSCKDEARIGNKGRVCHRWWLKGERAPGLVQQGYQWAYIFSAIRPATGEDFTLVLPVVSAAVMDFFLASSPPHSRPTPMPCSCLTVPAGTTRAR